MSARQTWCGFTVENIFYCRKLYGFTVDNVICSYCRLFHLKENQEDRETKGGPAHLEYRYVNVTVQYVTPKQLAVVDLGVGSVSLLPFPRFYFAETFKSRRHKISVRPDRTKKCHLAVPSHLYFSTSAVSTAEEGNEKKEAELTHASVDNRKAVNGSLRILFLNLSTTHT